MIRISYFQLSSDLVPSKRVFDLVESKIPITYVHIKSASGIGISLSHPDVANN